MGEAWVPLQLSSRKELEPAQAKPTPSLSSFHLRPHLAALPGFQSEVGSFCPGSNILACRVSPHLVRPPPPFPWFFWLHGLEYLSESLILGGPKVELAWPPL